MELRLLYRAVGTKTTKRKSGVYEMRYVELVATNSIKEAKKFIIEDFKRRRIKFSHDEDLGLCRILD